jgi:hypothetical protein
MAAKTTQSANDVLNYNLRNAPPTWGGATTFYATLQTGAVGLGGNATTNEAAYPGYARVPLDRDPTTGIFTAASGGSSSNNALIQFPISTGGPETETHASITTSASGASTVVYTGALSSPLVVNNNIRPEFDISTFVVQEQ